MTDPAHLQAQARKQQYQAEFLDSYQDRRDQIHPDDEAWCTDGGGAPCARCAPLIERHDEIRASLPKLLVWFDNALEEVLYRWWRFWLRLRRTRR